MDIRVKRIYDEPSKNDGRRVLVDRVWPRGLSKADARIDAWMKELAPSTKLRKWFGHDPKKWSEFKKRYFTELKDAPDPLHELLAHVRRGAVTLLYSARDTQHNQAVALAEYVRRGIK